MDRERKKAKKQKNQKNIIYGTNAENNETSTSDNVVTNKNKNIQVDTKVDRAHASQKKSRKRKYEDVTIAKQSEKQTTNRDWAKHVKRFQTNTSKPGVLFTEKTLKRISKQNKSDSADVRKPKLGTEGKLMEKLEELTGKSLRANNDTVHVTDVNSEAKTNKKRKNVFRMDETQTAEEENDLDAGLDPEKAALRKKKREKRREKKLEKQRRKQRDREKAGTGKVLAIDYLKQWDTDRESWKFQKVRQVYLLQNMFNSSEVSGSQTKF